MFIGSIGLLVIGLIFLLFLLNREMRSSVIVTPFLLFVATEVTFLWPATIYGYLTGVSPDAFPIFLAAVAFIAFLAGFLVFSGYQKKQHEYSDAALIQRRSNGYYLTGFMLVSGVLIILGAYQYQGIPPLTQVAVDVLSNSDIDAEQISSLTSEGRFDTTKSHLFGGEYRGQGLINRISQTGWSYLICVAVALFYTTRKRLWLLALAGSLMGAFVFIASSGRGPFLWVFVSVIMFFSFIKRIRLYLLPVAVIVLFMMFMGVSFMSSKAVTFLGAENPILGAAEALLERVFFVNGINDVWAITFARAGVLDYGVGQLHWTNILQALPGSHSGTIPYANDLYFRINAYISGDATTFATPTYISTLFVDFALPGVLAGFFLMGLLISWSQKFLYSKNKDILRLIFVVHLGFDLGRLATKGPITFMTSLVVLITIHILFLSMAATHVLFKRVGGSTAYSMREPQLLPRK